MSWPDRLLAACIRLYPKAWRERYGDEFNALLEDLPARTWRTVWDTGRSGLAMRMQQSTWIRTAVVFGLAGSLLAAAGSLLIRDRYLSQAVLSVDSGAGEAALLEAVQGAMDDRELTALLAKHRLYPGEAGALELLRRHVQIKSAIGPRSGRRYFTVSYQGTEAAAAQGITADLSDALMRRHRGLAILDSASLPQAIWPNRRVIAMLGFFAGALCGLGAWLLSRRQQKPGLN